MRARPNLWLTAALAVGFLPLVAVVGCDSGEAPSDPAGGGGGSGGAPSTELCDNGLDDDANGAIDCLDAGCATFSRCVIGGEECAAQVPTCEGNLSGSINEICVAGACRAAGPIQPDGTLQRGNIKVVSRLDGVRPDLARSFLVRVLHGRKPDGEALDCAAVNASADVEALANVVVRNTGEVTEASDTIPAPAFGLPVTSGGETFLVQSVFYSADRNTLTAEPTGEVVGFGCEEGLQVPPGDYTDDDTHNFGVVVKPICDPANDTCPAPKTCLIGARICRDQRCVPACVSGTSCRDLGDGPTCLRKCDPAEPICANLERCDASPGEQPICVPAQ